MKPIKVIQHQMARVLFYIIAGHPETSFYDRIYTLAAAIIFLIHIGMIFCFPSFFGLLHGDVDEKLAVTLFHVALYGIVFFFGVLLVIKAIGVVYSRHPTWFPFLLNADGENGTWHHHNEEWFTEQAIKKKKCPSIIPNEQEGGQLRRGQHISDTQRAAQSIWNHMYD